MDAASALLSGVVCNTYVQDAATFALEKGIDLLWTKLNEGVDVLMEKQIDPKHADIAGVVKNNAFKKAHNEMAQLCDQQLGTKLCDQKDDSTQKLTSLSNKTLQEIQKLSILIQEYDLKESLDWMGDACSALSANNINLFKNRINKSYEKARAAKNKIVNNPNNLLSVYSILIFCGFCIHSEFGEDIYAGLQHIKNTLTNMNSHPLLNKTMKNVTTSRYYWTKQESQFFLNMVMFSIKVRTLAKSFIIYAKNNVDLNDCKENKSDDEKQDDNDDNNIKLNKVSKNRFGQMIYRLFPNAMIKSNRKQNMEQLLEWREWCPNLFDGSYFGGDKNKVKKYQVIDFYDYIYPNIFSKQLKECRTFIDVYMDELYHYIMNTDTMSKCLKNNYTDNLIICRELLNTKEAEQLSLILSLHEKIKKHFETDVKLFKLHEWMAQQNIWNDSLYSILSQNGVQDTNDLQLLTDDQLDAMEMCLSPAAESQDLSLKEYFEKFKMRLKEYEKESNDKLKKQSEYVVNKLIITDYDNKFDKVFVSPCFALKSIYFDKTDETILLRFCYLMKYERNNQLIPYLEEISISNVTLSSICLNNSILFTLKTVCIGLKIMKLNQLQIEYKKGDNYLNLHFIPTNLEVFEYINIVHKNIDTNDDILYKFTNMNKRDNSQMFKALHTINMDGTTISNDNLRILLLDFVSNHCNRVHEISLSPTDGNTKNLTDDAWKVLTDFWSSFQVQNVEMSTPFGLFKRK